MFACTVLTLFPDMFPGPLGQSLAGEALKRGLWSLQARDIREHGLGRHRAVDDTPAGGERRRGARARRSAPAPHHEPAWAAVHAKTSARVGRRPRPRPRLSALRGG